MKQHFSNILWVVSQPQLLEFSNGNNELNSPSLANNKQSEFPDQQWRRRWNKATIKLKQQLATLDLNAIALKPLTPSAKDSNISIDASQQIFPRLLGHCYENYWHRIIAQLPEWSLELSNLQIIENKLTLGEIDAIVLDQQDQQYEHWEFSCKFYLLIGDDEDNPHHWVGPNHTDSLARKLKRLFEHQLPLIELPVVKKELAKRQIEISRQRVLLHGRLFTPFVLEQPDKLSINVECIAEHQDLNARSENLVQNHIMDVSACNLGQWCLIEQLVSIGDVLNGDDWVMLDKAHWMDFQSMNDISARFTTKALQSIITDLNRPTMVRHCQSGRCLFVISKQWLAAARNSIRLLNQ